MFGNRLDRKQAFKYNKNTSFVKYQKWLFPKGLTHGFSQKTQFFLFVFKLN